MTKPIGLRTQYMEFTQNITNELVTRYINSFYHPLTSELGALRQEAEAAEIPIILKETESYLRATLAILRPKEFWKSAVLSVIPRCFSRSAAVRRS